MRPHSTYFIVAFKKLKNPMGKVEARHRFYVFEILRKHPEYSVEEVRAAHIELSSELTNLQVSKIISVIKK